MTLQTPNPRAVIGGNNPPGPIDRAREAFGEVSNFLKDTPVVAAEDEARAGAAHIERTRVALAEMESERKALVDPLNAELATINARYRVVRDPLETLLKTLRRRLSDYSAACEAARAAEAERLARDAAEREAAARAAEAAEREAIENAEAGECTDVGAAVEQADASFAAYRRADREAARAARAVPVRFSSVTGGRAQTMRTVEVLTVTDAQAALRVLGVTDEIRDALLSAARKYRKAFGELPNGITARHERSF
jgi:hypothetical protein